MKRFSFFLFVIFVLSCGDMSPTNGISLEGEGKAKVISKFEVPQSRDCTTHTVSIPIPAPANESPDLREASFLEYCFEVLLKDNITDPILYLGYIDHFYRVYWNGKLIGSTSKFEKKKQTMVADQFVSISLKKADILHKNLLLVQVKKHANWSGRGGIHTGHPAIIPFQDFKAEELVKETYEFGRVIFISSAGILFLLLYLGKRRNLEFFWFSLYLFIEALHFSTQVQLQFVLDWDLFFWKRLEYVSLCFQAPIFGLFLLSILGSKPTNPLFLSFLIIEFSLALVFGFYTDIEYLSLINNIFHLPFLLFVIFGFFILIIRKWREGNPKAKIIANLFAIPGLISITEIINIKFLFFPELSQYKIQAESVTFLVLSMGVYLSYEFFRLEVDLERTIEKEKNLRKTFQLYVPPEDLEKILSSFSATGESFAEETERVILFCDMRNFTAITENLTPIETVSFLNSYFEVFSEIVIRKKDIVDKLIGDCIMARFSKENVSLAVEAGLVMIKELGNFNKARISNNMIPINHGIGISMGSVVEGNIGSSNKKDYTVIGDPVNLASRLESLTKFYKVGILVTESIYVATIDTFQYREIDCIRVMGKSEAIKIYEPLNSLGGFSKSRSLETTNRISN